MPVVINGTTGISGVAGSNATPAIQGTDTNTGLVFPAADTIAFVEGGTEAMRLDSGGNLIIGATSSNAKFTVAFQSNIPAAHTAVGSTDDVVQIAGTDGRALRLILDSNNQPNIVGRVSGGTLAAPSATLSGATLLTLTSRGYGTTGWNTNPPASFQLLADGNITDSSNPGRIQFNTAGPTGGPVERMRIDSSGNILFDSGYGSVALAYAVRAWVSFNGTNGTIFASQGVTSVTRNTIGDYRVNFNFTMPDANYAVSGAGMEDNGQNSGGSYQTAFSLKSSTSTTTTSCGILNANVDAGDNKDGARIMFMAVR